jgi:predicted RNA binding protein YcfA (HicA-like mRNA interferase family)
MKVPRNLSSERLIQLIANLGYETTRQTGSHIRLTTQENGQHHVTIPAHDPLKIGTLNSILRSIAEHFSLTKDELVEKIFNEQ